MRVYIAGPVTGKPDYKADFDLAAAALQREGHVPVNPAELDNGMGYEECMRRALQMMLGCDAVYLLPGWEASRGATLEQRVAAACGIPAYTDLTLIIRGRKVHCSRCAVDPYVHMTGAAQW